MPEPVRDCIEAMEAKLAESPPVDVDISELYASRAGSWLKRIHEVLHAWSLKSELPPGYCTYRYKGMRTALMKKCDKSVEPDAVTKILKLLADARVIERPKPNAMRRLPRLGHGYPVKVLVAPPGAGATQRRVLMKALALVDSAVAVPLIEEYLDRLCLNVAGDETRLRQYFDRIETR